MSDQQSVNSAPQHLYDFSWLAARLRRDGIFALIGDYPPDPPFPDRSADPELSLIRETLQLSARWLTDNPDPILPARRIGAMCHVKLWSIEWVDAFAHASNDSPTDQYPETWSQP